MNVLLKRTYTYTYTYTCVFFRSVLLLFIVIVLTLSSDSTTLKLNAVENTHDWCRSCTEWKEKFVRDCHRFYTFDSMEIQVKDLNLEFHCRDETFPRNHSSFAKWQKKAS